MKTLPLDDIMEEYGKLPMEKRSAVTNLICSNNYVSVCSQDEQGEVISLDWQANAGLSIHLLIGVMTVGKNEYGRLWLEDLKNKLSQIT
jgi:hypothetical protein